MSKKKEEGLGLTIDWETADRITILNLKQYAKMITEDIERLENLMEQGDIAECQSIDYVANVIHFKAITKVLEYFGEK
jgi:hypothetical protein